MSTPDPRRGDEPGQPTTPAPAPTRSPEHDSATPAFDDNPEPDEIGGDHQVIEPVDPREPEPDVNDGEAPQPMDGDDDIISGQYEADRGLQR